MFSFDEDDAVQGSISPELMSNCRVKTKHVVVTDNCRKLHSDVGAYNQVRMELELSYKDLLKQWPWGKGAEFHFEMYVEYPREAAVESTASQREEN